MKFLLEFVSCCGCAATTTSTAAADGSGNESVFVELGPSATSPRSEETLSLVNSSRQYRRRKWGRVGTSACGEWRPSLSSINEDHVVMIERGRRSEVERTVKRKGSFPGGSGDRSFRDDNGRNPFSVVPAFVPTPFMF